jgi:hypothetical protein
MKRFVVIVGMLGVAACSSITEPLGMEDPFAVPQPFKGVGRNDSMIDQAIQVTVLVVTPPEGLPAATGLALRDRVIDRARARDVPALREASVRAWTLNGQAASVQATGKRGAQSVILWRLSDPDGAERANFPVALKNNEEAFGEASLGLLAEQTAASLENALLRPNTQVAETIVAAKKPIAWIGAVKGAPGDGNTALARALAGVLPLKGVLVDEKQAKAEWRVEGIVKLEPGRDGQDTVVLTWRVLDAKGREAGSITQENAVPRGRLSKPWREIAGFAAEAAAEGIAQLIQQVTSGTSG